MEPRQAPVSPTAAAATPMPCPGERQRLEAFQRPVSTQGTLMSPAREFAVTGQMVCPAWGRCSGPVFCSEDHGRWSASFEGSGPGFTSSILGKEQNPSTLSTKPALCDPKAAPTIS